MAPHWTKPGRIFNVKKYNVVKHKSSTEESVAPYGRNSNSNMEDIFDDISSLYPVFHTVRKTLEKDLEGTSQ